MALYNLFKGGQVKAYLNLHCGSSFLAYRNIASKTVYNNVINNAKSLCVKRGTDFFYTTMALIGRGFSFSSAYNLGIQSWIFEFTSTWADEGATPPPLSTFKTQYFPPALSVLVAVAQSLG